MQWLLSWALRINVTLLPSTRGFSKAVNAELQGVERQAKASGKRAGDDLGGGHREGGSGTVDDHFCLFSLAHRRPRRIGRIMSGSTRGEKPREVPARNRLRSSPPPRGTSASCDQGRYPGLQVEAGLSDDKGGPLATRRLPRPKAQWLK